MFEETAPAPRHGLGVWIMSGSLVAVLLIGGGVAFSSRDKISEEGNPASAQTVAPGGGHTVGPTPPKPSPAVLGATLPGPDWTTKPDTSGQSAKPAADPAATDAGPTRGKDTRANSPGPAPATDRAQESSGQATAEAGAGTVQPGVPAGSEGSADLPQVAGARAVWSETGAWLRITFEVPTTPGIHLLTVAVDGRSFTIRVRVGADGQVTITLPPGHRNPYRYDPASGRLSGILVPADFDQPVFVTGSTVTTSTYAWLDKTWQTPATTERPPSPTNPQSAAGTDEPAATPDSNVGKSAEPAVNSYAENHPSADESARADEGAVAVKTTTVKPDATAETHTKSTSATTPNLARSTPKVQGTAVKRTAPPAPAASSARTTTRTQSDFWTPRSPSRRVTKSDPDAELTTHRPSSTPSSETIAVGLTAPPSAECDGDATC